MVGQGQKIWEDEGRGEKNTVTWLSLPYQDGGRSSWWEIQEHSQQKQRPLGAAHLGDQVREAGGRVKSGQLLALRCGRERHRLGPARRPFPSFWPPQPLPRACCPTPGSAPRLPVSLGPGLTGGHPTSPVFSSGHGSYLGPCPKSWLAWVRGESRLRYIHSFLQQVLVDPGAVCTPEGQRWPGLAWG